MSINTDSGRIRKVRWREMCMDMVQVAIAGLHLLSSSADRQQIAP